MVKFMLGCISINNNHHCILKKIIKLLLFVTAVALLMIFGCPVYRITGYTCPFCGITRAWTALFFEGNLKKAFGYNLFFWFVPVLLAYYLFYNKIPEKYSKPLNIFLIIISAVIFAWNIFRII